MSRGLAVVIVFLMAISSCAAFSIDWVAEDGESASASLDEMGDVYRTSNSAPSIIGQSSYFVGDSEIAILDSSHIATWNGTHLFLRDLAYGAIIDQVVCDRAYAFDGTTEYMNAFSVNRTRELITCGNTILEWNHSGFSHRYNGTYFMGVDPVHNTTAAYGTATGNCPNFNNRRTIEITRNSSIIGTRSYCIHYQMPAVVFDFVLSDGASFSMGGSAETPAPHWNICGVVAGGCNIQESVSGDYHRPGDIVNEGMTIHFKGNGQYSTINWRISNPYTSEGGSWISGSASGIYALQAADVHSICNIASISDQILLNGTVIRSAFGVTDIDCLDMNNYTFVQGGMLKSVWYDSDIDGVNDLEDPFPSDSTQWSDTDGDGHGDNPSGTLPDGCPSIFGNSTMDEYGCKDVDGDGWSDSGDAFPRDSDSWSDADDDGVPDQGEPDEVDDCPQVSGESFRNGTLGCPDADLDGWSDAEDEFVNESSQWMDTDADGYGDQLIGFEGDACPATPGNSTEDRYGCPDADGDGWSDDGDDMPSNPTQWKDRDGDGYGDNADGPEADAFPSDGTQWNDTDGDGHGDNPYGSEGDWFPDDPSRWADSDRDGVADEDDEFPNDATQWNDTDGDGYGDEETGNRGDAFPNDADEWDDSDSDGVGDNEDAFPFDPSQQTDGDGDGFGDNDRGSGADRFPDDPSQWSDIDGDGYGDNQTGNNADAFIADPTQWSDADGDGYGDNSFGRNADAFPNDPTQWEDQDGDGFGDNLSGNDPDPYLFDFDNDGYNDSIDPLPKLASPGDLDNDGCLDVDDAFPSDYKECLDFDGDGEGDNADTDDDNDGWADTDELRRGTDPFSASDTPVDSFEIVVPGTAIGLGAWDLIGIFGGVPLFSWLAFGFATRNARCGRFEEKLNATTNLSELEGVALQWEYALMMRLLGPHQGIRLERLRADLEDGFAAQEVAAGRDVCNNQD